MEHLFFYFTKSKEIYPGRLCVFYVQFSINIALIETVLGYTKEQVNKVDQDYV